VTAILILGLGCTSSPSRGAGGTGGGGQGGIGLQGAAGSTTGGAGGTGVGGGTGGSAPIIDSGAADSRAPGDAGADGSASDGPSDAPPTTDGPLEGALASAGCGLQPTQPPQMFVEKKTTAGTQSRVYRVWLPAGYDPRRPYRTIFLGHGCGDNNGCPDCGPAGTPFPGLEKVADAILVAMVAAGSCFDNGNGTSSSSELVYFDQALKEVSAAFCVDQSRVFVGGFSSGAWVTHLIGCARAGSGPGKVRAQITATGEWPNPPACTGPAAALMAHDMNDTNNPFAAGVVARDHILQTNKCGTTTIPYSYDGVTPASATTGNCAVTSPGCQPCVEYQGCTPGYPVIWCPTKGNNPSHSRQVPITTVGLWRFISQF
jgi:polyhydroxybutyrate depolymerase